jgi:methylmalonyl-CoA mutase, N-terminal domain
MKIQTRSGVPLQHAYLSRDREAERPGEFPFTRGRLSNAHTQTPWIQRELSGEGNGKRSNAQIHFCSNTVRPGSM